MKRLLLASAFALLAHPAAANSYSVYAEFDAYLMNFTDVDTVPETDGDFDLSNAKSFSGQIVFAGPNFTFELQGSRAGVLDEGMADDYHESSNGVGFYGHYHHDLGPGKAGIFGGVGRFKLVEDVDSDLVSYGLAGVEYAFVREQSTTAAQAGLGIWLSGDDQSHQPGNHLFASLSHKKAVTDRFEIGFAAHTTFGDEHLGTSDYGYFNVRTEVTFSYALSDNASLQTGFDWWHSRAVDTPNNDWAQYFGASVGVTFALCGNTCEKFRTAVPFDTPDLYRDYAWGFEVW